MAGRWTAWALTLATVWPTPPFDAWVRSGKVYLRSSPELSRQVGMVRRGDVVRVERCAPDCSQRNLPKCLQPALPQLLPQEPMNNRQLRLLHLNKQNPTLPNT